MNDTYLIDTQVLLWLSNEPDKISTKAISILKASSILLLSHASIWELSIKTSIGKLKIEFSLNEFLDMAINKHQLTLLPISLNAILTVQRLPFFHKDPFDRLLIAEAMTSSLPIVSSDAQFNNYPIKRIW